MAPGTYHRFLHKVLRPLPVTPGKVKRIAEESAAMLGVKRPNVCLIGYRARLGGGSRACHAMDYASGPGSVHDTPEIFWRRRRPPPGLGVSGPVP